MSDKQLAEFVLAARISAHELGERVFIVSDGKAVRLADQEPDKNGPWRLMGEVYPGGRAIDWRNVPRKGGATGRGR